MRIVHWMDNFLPLIGGAETFVRDLARTQMEAGHQVSVVSSFMSGRPEEETIAGIDVLRRPLPDDIFVQEPLKLGVQVRACAAIRNRLRPDLVHVHFTHIAAWFELLSRPASSCPVVITTHSPLNVVGTPHALTKRILTMANAIVTVSADVRTALREEVLANTSVNIESILNGVSMPALPPSPLFTGSPTIVGVGRIVEDKGFDAVLHALTHLPEVRFILGGDGPFRPQLENLARELGVAGRVEFRGWVHPDDVPALINEGDLVVMPSRWREPFGLVAVQAGQMGRPLVASRTGGLPEIVLHGETGLLVPVGDTRALAQAVRGLFTAPDAARRIGANARRHVMKNFSMERCAADYDTIYRRVAKTGRPA